ncbi:MAG: hypothetical protein HYZ34_07190, partial [Ignavibacteriae bacterium]|nr:hypothetical protein [Ignavibacteriota bacterium]
QSNTIFCLYEEPSTFSVSQKEVVWFGTDVGLIRFEEGQSKLFAEKEGLCGVPVMGIFLNENSKGDKLLIVTPKGLHQYEHNSIRLIQTFPFLSSENISINDVHYSASSNLLWIATPNGVYSLSVEERAPKIIPPKVLVTKMFVDTSLIYEFLPSGNVQEQLIELEHSQNNVMMEYASLSFVSESEVRYRFRLEPLEKTWSLLTKDRHVQYRNLNDGEYRFVVESLNGDGVSSGQEAQIQFVIAIPYWESWWFLSLSGFAFSGLLIGTIIYVSQRNLKRKLQDMERQQALQNERERISRDLHDNVGAQLVNIISGLELVGRFSESKQTEMRSVLDSLQGDARATMSLLRETIWALQSSSMTTDKFGKELELYVRKQLRYHPNIVLKFLVDGTTRATLRPVEAINLMRIVQEALSNSLKHASPTLIEIHLHADDFGVFQLHLSNDGCLKECDEELSGGKGIPNMERRAREIGGMFQFAHEDQTASVSVSIPIRRS